MECKDCRPWGHFEVLSEVEGHKVKRVAVLPGHRLSLQYHQHRMEHWVIISSEALVTCNGNQLVLKVGDSVDIPLGAIHRIQNIGKDMLVFIEIQQGAYLGEDDIFRLEDDYRRTLPAPPEIKGALPLSPSAELKA